LSWLVCRGVRSDGCQRFTDADAWCAAGQRTIGSNGAEGDIAGHWGNWQRPIRPRHGSIRSQKTANYGAHYRSVAMIGRDDAALRTCKGVSMTDSGAALSRHRTHVARLQKSGLKTGWTCVTGQGGGKRVCQPLRRPRANADVGQAEGRDGRAMDSGIFS